MQPEQLAAFLEIRMQLGLVGCRLQLGLDNGVAGGLAEAALEFAAGAERCQALLDAELAHGLQQIRRRTDEAAIAVQASKVGASKVIIKQPERRRPATVERAGLRVGGG